MQRTDPPDMALAQKLPPCSRSRSRTACMMLLPRHPGMCLLRTASSACSPRGRPSCPGGTCRGRSPQRGWHDPQAWGCSLLGSWRGWSCCRSRRCRLSRGTQPLVTTEIHDNVSDQQEEGIDYVIIE
eukprot:4000752-Prymnesium_polylepis.1